MDAEKELTDFSRRWDGAMVRNDAAEIGAYMSDDWVIVGTEGGITPKKDFLASVSSGDLVHARMDTDEVRVKIYGSSGVLTSKGTSAGTYKGPPFSFHEWATSMFVKENGEWKCVLTMLTPARGMV